MRWPNTTKKTFLASWTSGYCKQLNNADELSRKGTAVAILQEKNTIATSKLFIKRSSLRWKSRTKMEKICNCEISNCNSPRKSDEKILNDILTGHCLIGKHAKRIVCNSFDNCRSCQEAAAEEKENIVHPLCHCLAFNKAGCKLFGNKISK